MENEPPQGDIDDIIDRCVYLAHIDHAVYTVHPTETTASTPTSCMVTNTDPDYEALHPYFGWPTFDMVKETFTHTTQYARMPMSTYLKRQFKSPYPVVNAHHCIEPVATDTVYLDTPAIDSGDKQTNKLTDYYH
jgi:hypothetical protein